MLPLERVVCGFDASSVLFARLFQSRAICGTQGQVVHGEQRVLGLREALVVRAPATRWLRVALVMLMMLMIDCGLGLRLLAHSNLHERGELRLELLLDC